MSNVIKSDPEGLISKGNKIVSLANNYISEEKNVYDVAGRITSAWDDETSRKFVEVIRSYEDDFKRLGEVVEQLGDIIKKHGVRLRNSRDNLTDIASNI